MSQETISPLNRGHQVKKRFSVSLPEDMQTKLKQIADAEGMTLSQVLEQAAELDLFIRDEQEKGSKFYIQRLKEKLKELIL